MAAPHPLVAALAAERRARGITRSAIARRTGYTCQAVRNWENGHCYPRLEALEDYATALGMRLQLGHVAREMRPITPEQAARQAVERRAAKQVS